MSSINLKALKSIPVEIQTSTDQPRVPVVQYTYSDLKLDLEVGTIVGNFPANTTKDMTDIQVSYDFKAIQNAIENLFNSMPGQWILNPRQGIGLPRFLFRAVNENTAREIADAIVQNLTVYERRVKIVKLSVVGDPDANSYEITLVIQLVNVNNSSKTLTGTLANNRFHFNS